VAAPQSLTVWSDEADASSLPSLEKATEMTEPVPLLYSSLVQKCVHYTVLGMKIYECSSCYWISMYST
jgi:hypothetical protein